MIGGLASGPAGDTIFALASGAGRGAISVVRLSGPACSAIVADLAGTLPAARRASLRRLRGADGETLDQALVIWMPGPNSYTGEDSAELHLHGGRAVVDAVSDALLQASARPADPGEFSRRAVLNQRMTLLQAEAAADLVAAETKLQRIQALRLADGEHGRLLHDWTNRLTRCLAVQEAMIDFPEENLSPVEEDAACTDLKLLLSELRKHRLASTKGQRLRDGLTFVIIGAPNVGKSSLINALAGREAAIVSATPGTTRDPVTVQLEFSGIPVTLVDTAGLRETHDVIEAEGVRRALDAASRADLTLLPIDTSVKTAPPAQVGQLVIANKVDLGPPPHGAIGVSATTGAGMIELRQCLAEAATNLANPEASTAFTRARHLAALRDAEAALCCAVSLTQAELQAEETRRALLAIGRITGFVDNEAVLDVIFSSFCIGK